MVLLVERQWMKKNFMGPKLVIGTNLDLTFLLLSSKMILVQKALKKALVVQLRRQTYQSIVRKSHEFGRGSDGTNSFE